MNKILLTPRLLGFLFSLVILSSCSLLGTITTPTTSTTEEVVKAKATPTKGELANTKDVEELVDEEAQKKRREELAKRRLEAMAKAREAAQVEKDKITNPAENKETTIVKATEKPASANLKEAKAKARSAALAARKEQKAKEEALASKKIEEAKKAKEEVVVINNTPKEVKETKEVIIVSNDKPTTPKIEVKKTVEPAATEIKNEETIAANEVKTTTLKNKLQKRIKSKKRSTTEEAPELDTKIVATAPTPLEKEANDETLSAVKSMTAEDIEQIKIEAVKSEALSKEIAKQLETPKEVEAKPVKTAINPKFKPYFFPIEEMKHAQAYCYVSVGPNPDTTYRLMKTLVYKNNTIFITEVYNNELAIKNIIRESVNEEGVFVRDYTNFEVDGYGKSKAVVCGVDVDENLKWDMNKEDNLTLKLNYFSSLHPNYDITMNRKRTLVQETGSVTFMGKKLNTITVQDKEITTFTDNFDKKEDKFSYTYQKEFAEGIGLVKYVVSDEKKAIPAKTYELRSILSFEQFNSLARVKEYVKGN